MKIALFIHRRDLRIADNYALIAAHKSGMPVMPCFIFDPIQVGSSNEYRSKNAMLFMLNSLADLAEQTQKQDGRLYLFYGHAETVVKKLLKELDIGALFCNTDYTPFSKKRDAALQELCEKNNITFNTYHDALLNQPDAIMTGSGSPYSVFTPFYKRSAQEPVAEPHTLRSYHWYTKAAVDSLTIHEAYKKILGAYANEQLPVQGGRSEGMKILKRIDTHAHYLQNRDLCAQPTTHLSAHLKFGTISVREAYHAIASSLGIHHALLRQLYWRDFWTYIAYHNPRVFGHAYHEKYDDLIWNKSKKDFELWCEGNTGFPIVDAGMRELNTTGFMHNRVRMIVASFLTKDLHINWQWGEQYFAQQLVDYDPAVNNGNWQWSASTGCDAQPYFRIFNPWLQQKKFDPACEYIKKWVPELQKYTAEQIHNHYKKPLAHYPKPMVDHAIESAHAKQHYKKVA